MRLRERVKGQCEWLFLFLILMENNLGVEGATGLRRNLWARWEHWLPSRSSPGTAEGG